MMSTSISTDASTYESSGSCHYSTVLHVPLHACHHFLPCSLIQWNIYLYTHQWSSYLNAGIYPVPPPPVNTPPKLCAVEEVMRDHPGTDVASYRSCEGCHIWLQRSSYSIQPRKDKIK